MWHHFYCMYSVCISWRANYNRFWVAQKLFEKELSLCPLFLSTQNIIILKAHDLVLLAPLETHRSDHDSFDMMLFIILREGFTKKSTKKSGDLPNLPRPIGGWDQVQNMFLVSKNGPMWSLKKTFFCSSKTVWILCFFSCT